MAIPPRTTLTAKPQGTCHRLAGIGFVGEVDPFGTLRQIASPAGDGLRREFRSGSDTAVGGRRNLTNHVVAFQTIDPGLGRKVLVEVEIGGCGALPYGTARRLTRSASTTIPIFRSK